jgi:hypothetical protein
MHLPSPPVFPSPNSSQERLKPRMRRMSLEDWNFGQTISFSSPQRQTRSKSDQRLITPSPKCVATVIEMHPCRSLNKRGLKSPFRIHYRMGATSSSSTKSDSGARGVGPDVRFSPRAMLFDTLPRLPSPSPKGDPVKLRQGEGMSGKKMRRRGCCFSQAFQLRGP